MGKIKRIGIGAGIIVGSVVGGTVSFIGKMADKKEIDRLGENIMDSTILTGEIAGSAASGLTRIVAGTLKREAGQVRKGKRELGSVGERVLENAVENVRNVADQGEEILAGVKTHDRCRVNRGLRTLGKMAVVGMLTVGAVKVDNPVADARDAARSETEPPEAGQPETEKFETKDPAAGQPEVEQAGQAESEQAGTAKQEAEPPEAGQGAVGQTGTVPTLEEELEKKIRF